jgi:hypothetical protein
VIGEDVEFDENLGDEALQSVDGESHSSNCSTVSPVSAKVLVTWVLP